MDEAAFGVIATRIGYQLRRLDMTAMEGLHQLLAEIGVPPGRATALVYIDRHEGCDQTALGRALGINRASTMAAVNSLVALGAVERRPGRDRRSNALHLTDAGRQLLEEAVQTTAEHDMAFFGGLTEDEQAEFFRILIKLRQLNRVGSAESVPTTRARLRRVK